MASPEEETIIWWIISEWRSVRQQDRPWGVWIRQYATLPAHAEEISYQALPEAAWFMDDAGLRTESVDKWLRFVALRPSDASDAGKRLFAIAIAAFAPYANGTEYYIEAVWGPLHGAGRRWDPRNEDTPAESASLWRA